MHPPTSGSQDSLQAYLSHKEPFLLESLVMEATVVTEHRESKWSQLRRWLNDPPEHPAPRSRWITTLLGVIGVFFLCFLGLVRESRIREEQNCEQRVSAINSIRLVFLDVYSFAEEQGSDPENIRHLEERLNTVLPAMSLEECLNGDTNGNSEVVE